MKNSNEMVNSLFERREQYVAEQSKKRKNIMRITSVACSFVLVALIGVGIWQSPWLKQTAPSTTDNPGISGEKQPSNDELPGNKAYPYDDKIQYLPKEMPVSKYENGFASLDVDLADQVLRALGGICVLGVDLTAEESREISRHIDSLRKEKLRKEREKQNAVFQKYREKEES